MARAGWSADTRWVLVDRTGDTLYVRRFPYRGVPIPENLGDSAMQAVADRWRDRGRPEVAEAFEEQVTIPPVYPPVESALVGRDGTLWIRLRDTDEGRPYLALDTEGEPIGTAFLPRSAEVLAADRSHLWTVERDEVDVPSVVRYQVEQHVSGG